MTPIPKAIRDRVTIKNIKSGFGHDLAGAYADVYLDGKKYGYYNDDGWGGEPDIQLNNDGKEIEELLKTENFAQTMFDNGWNFMGSVDRINMGSQLSCLFDELINLNQLNKSFKKGIVAGDSDCFKVYNFRGLNTLQKMVDKYGKDSLQKYVDEVKLKLKEGESILNTEELKAFGITV